MEIEISKAPENYRKILSESDDLGNKNRKLDNIGEARMAVGICRYDAPKDLPGMTKYLNENGFAVKMEMDIAVAPERFRKHMAAADNTGNKNGKIDSIAEARAAAKLCREQAPDDLEDMWNYYDDNAFMIRPENVTVTLSLAPWPVENPQAQEKRRTITIEEGVLFLNSRKVPLPKPFLDNLDIIADNNTLKITPKKKGSVFNWDLIGQPKPFDQFIVKFENPEINENTGFTLFSGNEQLGSGTGMETFDLISHAFYGLTQLSAAEKLKVFAEQKIKSPVIFYILVSKCSLEYGTEKTFNFKEMVKCANTLIDLAPLNLQEDALLSSLAVLNNVLSRSYELAGKAKEADQYREKAFEHAAQIKDGSLRTRFLLELNSSEGKIDL